jgi:peptide/nickel transport system permease protein
VATGLLRPHAPPPSLGRRAASARATRPGSRPESVAGGQRRFPLGLVLGAGLVLLALVAAAAAPWLAPYPPLRQHLDARLVGPSPQFWLGTDELGRDILSRLVYGARISLLMAFGAMGLALPLGCLLGLWAGFRGGWAESAVMRAMDVLLAFPTTLLALVLVASLGPSPGSVVLALGVAYLPFFVRVTRGAVLRERSRDYVLAARALGQTPSGLLRRHLAPNVAPDVVVQLSLATPGAMLAEAGLSFLGLGVSPAEPSWGRMLSNAATVIHSAPHVALKPLAPLIGVVLGFFLLADNLRRRLDPRARRGAGGAP